MKKLFCLILVTFITLFALTAQAEPYLVCNPQDNTDGFIYSLNGGVDVEVPYQTGTFGGEIKAVIADVGGLAPGPFTYQVRAFKNDTTWGRLESSVVPFVSEKPGIGSPSNLGLAR